MPSPSAPAPPRAPTVLAAVNGPDDGIVPQARASLACARASDTCYAPWTVHVSLWFKMRQAFWRCYLAFCFRADVHAHLACVFD